MSRCCGPCFWRTVFSRLSSEFVPADKKGLCRSRSSAISAFREQEGILSLLGITCGLRHLGEGGNFSLVMFAAKRQKVFELHSKFFGGGICLWHLHAGTPILQQPFELAHLPVVCGRFHQAIHPHTCFRKQFPPKDLVLKMLSRPARHQKSILRL